MITIKEHQFHDRDKTVLYSRKELCDITIMYGVKINYILIPLNVIFHFILHVLDLRSESLNKFYQTES
jgi:hypothetical protein